MNRNSGFLVYDLELTVILGDTEAGIGRCLGCVKEAPKSGSQHGKDR